MLMNDAELEEFLTKRFERRWRMLIYGLNIWGWLFIAVVLFALASSANGR